jgi:hypothetical protein
MIFLEVPSPDYRAAPSIGNPFNPVKGAVFGDFFEKGLLLLKKTIIFLTVT